MKVKDFFRQSALMLLLASGIVSCTETADNAPKDSDSKEVIVPLSFSGEILDMGTTPLSRAAGNDLLYIQVYTVYDDGEISPYSHGLFDDVSNMKIALVDGAKYTFFATMVKDGKNRIHQYDDEYGMPFGMPLTNRFVIDGNLDFYGISVGGAELKDNGYFMRPNIERYFGISDMYVVDAENIIPVKIDMIKTVFGVKVVTENFNDGQLVVELSDALSMIITEPNGTASDIFSFVELVNAYNADALGKSEFTNEYTEYAMVRILRISNGETIPVDEKEILFTRNMLTTLKVRIESNMYENGVSITTETSEMLPDDQDEIEFVGGGDF